MRASYALGGRGTPENHLIELDGLTAAICPGAPDRSVVNGVVYEQAGALAGALDHLAKAHEEAGVRAWTAWVPTEDRETARLLESAGHVLDAVPRAMAMDLAALGPPPGPEPEWTGDWSSLPDAGLINDRAYGDSEGTWSSALGGLPAGSAHLHRALVDARNRGCRTSTTQATKMSTPVYERIGYRDLGTLEMWERRRVRG